MKIFTYWEGQKPEYINVCIKTMRQYCENFTLLTPENVDKYLDGSGLHDNWKRLKNIAHRADCIRVAIINKYGGWWIDCDTVVIKPMNEDTLYFPGKKFLYMKWSDGRCLNGYFFGEQGCRITTGWLSGINKKLSNLRGIQWTSLGEAVLTPLIRADESTLGEATEINRRIFLPVNIDKIPWVFWEPIHWTGFISNSTVCIGLNHSFFRDNKKDFLFSSYPWDNDTLIGQLLNDFH